MMSGFSLKHAFCCSFLLSSIAACASTSSNYLASSVEQFVPQIRVVQDEVNKSVSADTDRLRREKITFDLQPTSDIYARAKRDNAGHLVEFFVLTTYKDWLWPETITFGTPIQSVPLTRVHSAEICVVVSCVNEEHVIGELTDDQLREIIADDAPEILPLRISTREGTVIERQFNKNEMIALLNAVGISL